VGGGDSKEREDTDDDDDWLVGVGGVGGKAPNRHTTNSWGRGYQTQYISTENKAAAYGKYDGDRHVLPPYSYVCISTTLSPASVVIVGAITPSSIHIISLILRRIHRVFTWSWVGPSGDTSTANGLIFIVATIYLCHSSSSSALFIINVLIRVDTATSAGGVATFIAVPHWITSTS
jgi:hypothetical protein